MKKRIQGKFRTNPSLKLTGFRAEMIFQKIQTKLTNNAPDDEDNAVVIVDLVDIVCKKQKWSPEKVKWEFRYKR